MAPKDHATILKQFREELTKENLLHEGDSIGTDDATLQRFLRARQYNLKNAKVMWKNCYEWRKNAEGLGIDELYRRIDPFDYPERNHVFQFWPLFFHKTDKRGRPVNIHHFGRINTTELYKGITPERFWQAFLVNAESLTREVLPAASSAAGRPIDGTLVIVDLKGFGTGQFWQMKNLARGAFQVSQDYFPETMSHLAIVNAPSSFTAIWAVMRPWLAKETVAKISVLGANYQSALLDIVPAENLPKTLGGTCTCDDCDVGSSAAAGEPKTESLGVAEMGRCAFSSAGPWLVGRDERRAAWLKGERKDIGLYPGEYEEWMNKEKTKNSQNGAELSEKEQLAEAAPQETAAPRPSTPPSQDAASETSQHQADEPSAEDSSEDASAGPSTPGVDSIQEGFDHIAIKDHIEHQQHAHPSRQLTPEESMQRVADKHPETRQVQTGDLYLD